jgi:hypothetical protein
MGADRPPYGARHRRFCPLSDQESMSWLSREIPSRFGPRISGQSPTGTWPALCAVIETPAATITPTSSQSFFMGVFQISFDKLRQRQS